MVCNSISSLFLSRVLVVVFPSLNMEIYLRGLCNVKIYIATFQKKMRLLKRHFERRMPMSSPNENFQAIE